MNEWMPTLICLHHRARICTERNEKAFHAFAWSFLSAGQLSMPRARTQTWGQAQHSWFSVPSSSLCQWLPLSCWRKVETPGLCKDMIGAGPLDLQHVTSFQLLLRTHEQREKWNYPVLERGDRVLECRAAERLRFPCPLWMWNAFPFPLQRVLKSRAIEDFKWAFCYVINIQTRAGNCSLWLILLTGGKLCKVLTGGYVFYVLMLLMYNAICPELELRQWS